MSETELQALRAATFLGAACLALALQYLAPHARLRGSWPVNLWLWALNGVVLGVVCGACACAAARWAEGAGVGLLNVVATPSWLRLAVTIAALDLVSYAWHRANHAVPLLWRFHRVHHSDTSFTVSTGVRFHPGELLLSLPLRLAAVVALGAPVAGVLVFEAVFTLANLVEHGDIAFPRRLERGLALAWVTPALHRWHHHRDATPYRNFGTIFTVWDRLLDTYGASEGSGHVVTGVADLSGEVTLGRALRLPFEPGA